jgi:23S rRNA (uracil1939-C5)-methyltransferase
LLFTIEKMIYGGDGLARLPADESPSEKQGRGKAVFVPFVLEGEKIEARLTEQKPGFARAAAAGILEPSPHRVQPACPYFTRCGGCHYQHTTYEHQLQLKKDILRETLRRTAKLDLPCEIQLHPSPPWNYRNRSRLQLRTKPEFILGYFKPASQEVLAVEQCPISSPLINRAIAAVWQLGSAGSVPDGIRELEFFANSEDSQLLVELGCASDVRRASVRSFAEELRATLPEIAGVVAFREQKPGSAGRQEKILSAGVEHLNYTISLLPNQPSPDRRTGANRDTRRIGRRRT